MAKPTTFSVGDKVAYASAFLKWTGQYAGDAPFLRGEVTSVEPFGAGQQLCTIAWSLRGNSYEVRSQYHTDGLGRVISPNLTLLSRIAIDAALGG